MLIRYVPADGDAVMHSFPLVDAPPRVSAAALMRPPDGSTVESLQHAECLVLMQFGAPIVSAARLQLRRFAMFGQWDDQSALDRFLDTHPLGRRLAAGWHVRLEYRQLGRNADLRRNFEDSRGSSPRRHRGSRAAASGA